MIDLIKAATLSGVNETRSQSEAAIMKMRQEQTQQFFMEASKLFSSDSVDPNIRQSIGAVLASSILFKTPKGLLWDTLYQGAKQSIKDQVLNVLLNKQRLVRRAAANVPLQNIQVVSAICCIEIPRKQWPDIVVNLAQGLKNPVIEVRQVSIITLNFICERLKFRGDYNLDSNEQETILSGILVGIKEQSKEIKQAALKALRDIIFSMSDVLANQQYRNFLVKHIAQSVLDPSSSNLAIQALTQFAKYNYQYLQKYINGFYTLLEPILLNWQKEDLCIQASQFWQTIAEEYQTHKQQGNAKIQNYIVDDLAKKLISIFLQNLCVMKSQNQDEQNPIRDSALSSLNCICECGTQKYKELFINFTTRCLEHVDWKFRQASIQCFTLMIVGLDKKNAQEIVSSSIIELLKLLNDQAPRVKLSSIEALVQISNIAGVSILNHPNFINILQLIMSYIGKSEKYTKHIGSIIRNLCRASQSNKLQTFYNIANDLISALIQGSLTTQCSLQSINDSLLTIMDLIQVSRNHQLCLNYIKFVIDNFGNLKLINGERKQQLQCGFLTIVQTCLISLSKIQSALDLQMLEAIYNLVIDHFRKIGDVNADGIYIVGALTLFIRQPTMTNEFWPYIQHALKKYQQPDLFKATLSCICDFVRHYGQILGNKLSFISILLQLLKDAQFSRQAKLEILQCIGEIFLHCHRSALPYFQNVMSMILFYCDGAIQMTVVDFDFSEQVKECILDVLTCILHGLNQEGKPSEELSRYLENIFQFIKLTVDKSNRPTISYILKSMLLVADIRSFYSNNIDQFTKQQYIFESIDNLQKYNKNNQYKKQIDYIISKL